METITLEELAPYLPYGLRAFTPWNGRVSDLIFQNVDLLFVHSKLGFAKPLMLPLSALYEEIAGSPRKLFR